MKSKAAFYCLTESVLMKTCFVKTLGPVSERTNDANAAIAMLRPAYPAASLEIDTTYLNIFI